LNPYHIVHPSKIFKQENETVKTTCIPNTIKIPTHRVDLCHHGLGFGERTPNHQWSHCKVKREERRRKERRKKEKERVCPILRMSHTDRYDTIDV
jgi:hypothetical protein